MVYYIISRNTLCTINNFLIIKTEDIWPLIKSIQKEESLYIEILNIRDLAFEKKDLINIDGVEKMSGRNKDTKIPNIRHIILKNKYTISSQ